ncbi:nicotinamide/nicotinic acid mononucleotide adenylyltransferase 3 isoform X1 [Diabrotica undecimpunctata]|uniref:nicotinamide/nicotinic acid mononucleotide adenylyltransferase 3 isoform X1 n=1 Tax=Diabrotica undecimpunctata TaxID=50387 RepID=UPI003B63747F
MGPPSPIVLLACGSFNPPTNMHLRMFELARDYLHRMGQHVVLGGVISPVHDGYGKEDLMHSNHRLEMVKLALQNHDWVSYSNWECNQESWTRTREVLQYHQNHINAAVNESINNLYDINENELRWIPETIRNGDTGPVRVKLLCGADLLESFGTPSLWANEDLEEIVGRHGLVVITRSNSNPAEFIYNSDLLTKYMANITIVTEWITNEISSTKVRRALRRNESVKYILPDKVVDYIHKNGLYGSQKTLKYLHVPNSVFLTPSPTDITMDSPSPKNCMSICDNNLFSRQQYGTRLSIDTVDSFVKPGLKHPGQAVKVVKERLKVHTIVNNQPEQKASLVRPACL